MTEPPPKTGEFLPALPTEIEARVTPDSLLASVLRTLHEECVRRDMGSTVGELEAAAGRSCRPWPAYLHEHLIHAMRRGLVQRSGSRGSYRYYLVGFVEVETGRKAARSDSEIVLDAVRLACDAAGTMVPTPLVQREIDRHGWALTRKARGCLTDRLRSLGRGGSGAPVRTEGATSPNGARRRFWAPTDRPDLRLPDPVITSANEGVQVAVRELTAMVGRPVSPTEVWLYVRSLARLHPLRFYLMTDPVAQTQIGSNAGGRYFARYFAQAQLTSRYHEAKRARAGEAPGPLMVLVRSVYFAPGAAPSHFVVTGHQPEPTPIRGFDVVHLDGFVGSLAADHEVGTLSRLTAGAPPSDLAALAGWTQVRRAALRAAVYRFLALAPGNPLALTNESRVSASMRWSRASAWPVPADAAEPVIAWLRDVAAAADGADRVFERLTTAEEQHENSRSRLAYRRRVAKRRLAARRRRVVDIIFDLLLVDNADVAASNRGGRMPERRTAPLVLVGEPGTAMRLDGFLPWAAPYFGLESGRGISSTPVDDLNQRQARSAFREALRPCRRSATERSGSNPESLMHASLRALIDRVDGLMALVDSQPDVWTRAMVRRSCQLLGSIARDTGAFDAVLAHVAPNDGLSPGLRRRIVVAGGLIGAPATLAAAERLITLTRDGGDTRAVGVSDGDVRAAALATAFIGPEALSSVLQYAEKELPPAAFTERLSKLRKRARRGLLLSVGAA